MGTTMNRLVAWLERPAPPSFSVAVWSVLGAASTLLLSSFLPIWSLADPAAPLVCPYEFKTLGRCLGIADGDLRRIEPEANSLEDFLKYHRVLALSAAVLVAGMKLGWMLNQRDKRSVAARPHRRLVLALSLCFLLLIAVSLLLGFLLDGSSDDTEARCARITQGMSLEEVEAILNGPPSRILGDGTCLWEPLGNGVVMANFDDEGRVKGRATYYHGTSLLQRFGRIRTAP
jgi:hypothetical protein